MEPKVNNWGGVVDLMLNCLFNVEVVEYKGQRCVVIPVEENGISITDRGNIFLSFYLSKMSKLKWGKTYSLKRKLTREEYFSMSKEQIESRPIVGYFEPFKQKNDLYGL